MHQLHYLTVQDILWVHLQVTNKVQPYDFARLEEAVFYQYAYGESAELLPQASRFLSGFIRMHPFEAANEATALISCAAFLRLNGKALTADQGGAGALLASAAAGRVALDSHVTDAPDDEHLDAKTAMSDALAAYGTAISAPAA